MPPVFKALSTITVWVLFILGWIGVVFAIVGYIDTVVPIGLPTMAMAVIAGIFAGGVVCFILSACAMKLRQMLE
jgi:hypothetical protein